MHQKMKVYVYQICNYICLSHCRICILIVPRSMIRSKRILLLLWPDSRLVYAGFVPLLVKARFMTSDFAGGRKPEGISWRVSEGIQFLLGDVQQPLGGRSGRGCQEHQGTATCWLFESFWLGPKIGTSVPSCASKCCKKWLVIAHDM